MTNNQSTNCLDFTNLFTKLKNGENYLPKEYRTRTSIRRRDRPRSMYIVRETEPTAVEDNKTTMRHTSYTRKWATGKDVGFKARLLTEQSTSCANRVTAERSSSLKYLALNNYCLKKIPTTYKTEEDQG